MLEVTHTLYRHRELIGILVAKQLKLRYRGSVLGFLWTLLNPLLLMLVYTLVFSVYFRLDMEKYPAFLFAGLLPWIWFASSLQQGVTCILDGAGLVTRSQFPAEVLPVVTVLQHRELPPDPAAPVRVPPRVPGQARARRCCSCRS